jgi:hypothetical protein
MEQALLGRNSVAPLSLETVFQMTESWWTYHRDRWCDCKDEILADLARRHRDRRLFKTVRVDRAGGVGEDPAILSEAATLAEKLGFDPRYYVTLVENSDMHRGKIEESPLVLLDSGKVVPVTDVEPMIAKLSERSVDSRTWLAVPQEIKVQLGVRR